MLLSVVSASVAVLGAHAAQDGLTAPLSKELANAVAPSVLRVYQAGVLLGEAVVVTSDGRALTSGEVAFNPIGTPRSGLQGETAGSGRFGLVVDAFDSVTDLALLQVVGAPAGVLRQAALASSDPPATVLMVLPSGPARGEVTRVRVAGVLGPSRRFTPLIEFRLERSLAALAGAPVFAPDGKLVGLLMASLTTGRTDLSASARGGMASFKAAGPRPAATTYSVGVPVLRRVIQGLTGPSRHVSHPWIGIYFLTDRSGGALISKVVSGGPAALSGLAPGERIVQAGGSAIATHLDLAAYLFQLPVGGIADLTVVRGSEKRQVKVAVVADPTNRSGGTLRRVAGTGGPFSQ